jgi:hypothetical protein
MPTDFEADHGGASIKLPHSLAGQPLYDQSRGAEEGLDR